MHVFEFGRSQNPKKYKNIYILRQINNIYNSKKEMPKEQYAFNLDQLTSFVSQLTSKKLKETIIEDFNNTYEIQIDVLSPKSLYLSAQTIQKRARKQISSQSGFSKASLMNQWYLGEKTVLYCTIIYFLALENISIQSITENSLSPLKKIFLTKDISLMTFQARHLLNKTSLKKVQWQEEDIELLVKIMTNQKEAYVTNQKCFKWKEVAYEIFLKSTSGEFYTAKECRQKWMNHLNPQLLKSNWSWKEDMDLLLALNEYGCKWAFISKKTGGLRTEHMMKNRAHAIIKKVYKKKPKKIEKKHIEYAIEALRDETSSTSGEQENESTRMQNFKDQEPLHGSCVVQNELKMDIEGFYILEDGKGMNVPDLNENFDRLILVQDVGEQWEYNEQGNSRDLFAIDEFNYQLAWKSYIQ